MRTDSVLLPGSGPLFPTSQYPEDVDPATAAAPGSSAGSWRGWATGHRSQPSDGSMNALAGTPSSATWMWSSWSSATVRAETSLARVHLEVGVVVVNDHAGGRDPAGVRCQHWQEGATLLRGAEEVQRATDGVLATGFVVPVVAGLVVSSELIALTLQVRHDVRGRHHLCAGSL